MCVYVWYEVFLCCYNTLAFLSSTFRSRVFVCMCVCVYVYIDIIVAEIFLFFFCRYRRRRCRCSLLSNWRTNRTEYTVCTLCCDSIHNILFVCRVSNCMCHLLFYNPTYYKNPVRISRLSVVSARRAVVLAGTGSHNSVVFLSLCAFFFIHSLNVISLSVLPCVSFFFHFCAVFITK